MAPRSPVEDNIEVMGFVVLYTVPADIVLVEDIDSVEDRNPVEEVLHTAVEVPVGRCIAVAGWTALRVLTTALLFSCHECRKTHSRRQL